MLNAYLLFWHSLVKWFTWSLFGTFNTYKPAYRTMVLLAYSVWIISLNMEFKDISTPLKPQLGCLAAVHVRSDQCQSVFDEVF